MKIADVIGELERVANNSIRTSRQVKKALDLTGSTSTHPEIDPRKVQTRRTREEVEKAVYWRRRKAALNARLERLWENPEPDSQQKEAQILADLEKADIELESLGHGDTSSIDDSSAFFFRGGVSAHIDVADTNFENVDSLGVRKHDDRVWKAKQAIDLDPNPMGTTTDDSEVGSIDLSSLRF